MSIKLLLLCSIILLVRCAGSDQVKEIDNTEAVSEQESFINKITQNHLLCSDSIKQIAAVIKNVTDKTKFKNQFQINESYNPKLLNFYIIDSQRDSSVRNLCAYAGKNTIFLDRFFLKHYLDNNQFLGITGNYNFDSLYKAFQTWVIGHEVAHADLSHGEGHFINSSKPKTQNEAWKFHSLELEADRHSTEYLEGVDRKSIGQMLVAIFNQDFDKSYLGVAPESKFKYLKMDNDEYMTYPYKLDGSHSTMAIRAAVFIYLMTSNKILREESYLFLTKSQLHIINELTKLHEDSVYSSRR